MKDQLKPVVLRVFNVSGIREMAPDGSREAALYEFSSNLHQRVCSNCSTSASILCLKSSRSAGSGQAHLYVILYEPPRVKFACVISYPVNVEAIKKALKLKQFSVIYRKSLLLPLSNRNRGDS